MVDVVVVVVVEEVVGMVIGTFGTWIGFRGFFLVACVVESVLMDTVEGLLVTSGVLLVNGFLVAAFGGEILIWIRLSSARVVVGTGRRVVLLAGGRGRRVVEEFDLM